MFSIADRSQAPGFDAAGAEHAHDSGSPGGRQLPVGGIEPRADRQVVGKPLHVVGSVVGCQDAGDTFDQVEGAVQRQRITAGKQQAGAQFDLDPQLVGVHPQVADAEQLAEGGVHGVGNILERILTAAAAAGAGAPSLATDSATGVGVGERGMTSPSCIGSRVFGAWLNTPISDSVRTLYLPSLTEEMEYMTTKKANNRVMKSA